MKKKKIYIMFESFFVVGALFALGAGLLAHSLFVDRSNLPKSILIFGGTIMMVAHFLGKADYVCKIDHALVWCSFGGDKLCSVDLDKEIFWQRLYLDNSAYESMAIEESPYYYVISNKLFKPYPEWEKEPRQLNTLGDVYNFIRNERTYQILLPEWKLSKEEIDEIKSWTEIHTVAPELIPRDAPSWDVHAEEETQKTWTSPPPGTML